MHAWAVMGCSPPVPFTWFSTTASSSFPKLGELRTLVRKCEITLCRGRGKITRSTGTFLVFLRSRRWHRCLLGPCTGAGNWICYVLGFGPHLEISQNHRSILAKETFKVIKPSHVTGFVPVRSGLSSMATGPTEWARTEAGKEGRATA